MTAIEHLLAEDVAFARSYATGALIEGLNVLVRFPTFKYTKKCLLFQ
jgi:hypothetical protein